jgi:hypothetical protein
MRASVDMGSGADAALLRIRGAARAPLGALLLAISGLWLWAGIKGIVAGDTAIMPGLGAGGAYLVGALGVALALPALNWIVRGRTVVISHDTVAVTDRSLRGRRAWREPLANYTELRAYRELRRIAPACAAGTWSGCGTRSRPRRSSWRAPRTRC